MRPPKELPKWKRIATKPIVRDDWLTLRADTYRTPNGGTIDPYYLIQTSDWVSCLVVDSNDDVLLVRQYRPGADRYILEIVSGTIEQNDTTPESSMRRELREEVGYVDGELYRTGVTYANPALQTNKSYSFLAVGGKCTDKQELDQGETLVLERIPFKNFTETFLHAKSDDIHQSHNLATIFFGLHFLGHPTTQTPMLSHAKQLISHKNLF